MKRPVDGNNDLKPHVKLIVSAEELEKAHAIRTKVFIEEQNVPPEDEIDEYESKSRHFLAEAENHFPCGTARWRFTEKGIKLERFAVLKAFRGRGVGSALVRAILDDISGFPESESQLLYLHAQLGAIPLYGKFGFEIVGNEFEECGIRHYAMTRPPGKPTAI